MKEFAQILNKNEKILWEGKPNFGPFVAKSLIAVPFGFLFLMFSLFWTGMTVVSGAPFFFSLFGSPFILLGLLIMIEPPLYALLVYQYVYYVITDKRVLIQGGLIGRDFKIVDFDKIQNAEVNVGLFDKMFGENSGSISIATGGTIAYGKYGPYQLPYILNNIENPYKVFEFFKQVSHDVKTDIEYPNALRPKTNPGYKTDYQSSK